MLFVSTHDVERKNEDALATRLEKDFPLLSAVRPRFAVDGGVCRGHCQLARLPHSVSKSLHGYTTSHRI